MKLVSSALFVAAAFAVSAAAPPPIPSHQAAPSSDQIDLARRFVAKTLSSRKLMDAIRMQAAASVEGCGCEGGNDPASIKQAQQDSEDVVRFLNLVEPTIQARVPKLLEAYSQAYAREFSADELKEMVSFAESPAGSHYLNNRMDMEQDPGVMEQERGFMLDLLPAAAKFRKQQCMEHTAQRIAAGDKTAKCPLAAKDETAAG